jgi:hypothetical protein
MWRERLAEKKVTEMEVPALETLAFPMYKIHEENNTLIFSWKTLASLYAVSIPPGDYTIPQINDAFRLGIESVTNKEAQITILPGTIIIEAPNYIVDIYMSSIRSILGWPENPPTENHPMILTFFNSVHNNGVHQYYRYYVSEIN